MIAKKGEQLIHLVHSQRLFALFKFPHEPKPDTASLGQLNLCESRFVPQFLNLFAQLHRNAASKRTD
jgi:hypothetical protein